MSVFSNPDTIANYAEGPVRLVPGFRDMQRMTALLLAEHAPDDAQILVLGAGGGLELAVFAGLHPGWRFLGVDPSADMLELAARATEPHAARIRLLRGLIDDAPQQLFDGATCLLVLHFLSREQRLATLTGLRQRLKPGAPLIVAHHSFPRTEAEEPLWLNRYAAFAISSGVPADKARNAATAIAQTLPILSPDEDEAMLHEAGFRDVALFYAGFTVRGWIANAPPDP